MSNPKKEQQQLAALERAVCGEKNASQERIKVLMSTYQDRAKDEMPAPPAVPFPGKRTLLYVAGGQLVRRNTPLEEDVDFDLKDTENQMCETPSTGEKKP
jgi:hypothetical protein